MGGKDESLLEGTVAGLLKAKGWTLSVAESCTGGLISHRLTNIAGSSEFIRANLVVYSEAEKTRFLGVKEETLQQYGVISDAVAQEMALGLSRMMGCDFSLSITGLAGPEGDDRGKQPGLAYVGLAVSKRCLLSPQGGEAEGWVENIQSFPIHVNSAYSREDIKYQFSQHALFFLWKALNALNCK
jgi:nicotinamide-nucleotide amidase